MIEKTLIKQNEKNRISNNAAKQLNKDKGVNSCNSCGVCNRLRSPHSSSEGALLALSQAKAIGKESCAASFMQRNYGNGFTAKLLSRPSAVGGQPTIQKKSSCGGSCSNCKGEEEADKVSMSIMKMESPVSRPPSADSGLRSMNNNEQGVISEIMANKGSGQGLNDNTSSFMGERFGYDFSHVRLHNDNYAARKSNELNAEAFTVGKDVFFNVGRYNSSSIEGKRLLAHELTHVVQQEGTSTRILQRTIAVEDHNDLLLGPPPKRNWEEVRDYMSVLSPSFVVNSSGNVRPSSGTFCTTTPSRLTDRCLCDLHNSTNPEPWKIKIDDNQWPHTEEADRRVTVHSTRSVVSFGAWGGGAAAGQRISQDNARVLGHELCGHAWLIELGIHPPFVPVTRGGRLVGRPSHDITVMIENRVAQEIYGPGVDLRGTFPDPHHGESFARVTVSGFPSGSAEVSSLSPDMMARVDRVKDFMVSEPLVKADIIGHADHTGSASANINISKKRARSVRKKLVSPDIARSRFMAVIGKSNTECPPMPTINPDCRKADIFMFIFEAASERSS